MWGTRMKITEEELNPNNFNGVYAEIAALLGVDAAIKLHSQFRGTQISFPIELLNREYIFEQIVKEYNGTNIKELATKYGYTEKWIRKIIKSNAAL